MSLQFSQTEVQIIAKELLGQPNKSLSTKSELRFGSHGSLSVHLEKGTWHSHEAKIGGGMLSLIEREKALTGRDAFNWLRQIGVSVAADDVEKANGHSSPTPEPNEKLTAQYDYIDEGGETLFQVCRFERDTITSDGKKWKTFRQRKPDPKARDGWSYKVQGVRQVPYRLPELIEAIGNQCVVFVAEGEKAVDALWSIGVPATCNAGGAGKWPDELTPIFEGADVVILPDDDPQARNKQTGEPILNRDGTPHVPGMDHARLVASKLHGIAKRVRVLELFSRQKKEDAFDWVHQGGDALALFDLVEARAREWPFEKPFVSRFRAVRWRELDAPAEEHEWLVSGWVTRGERFMVAGPSKSGKSFLAIDLAMAICRGEPWFGARVMPGAVLYQAGEGAKGIRKRLRAYRIRHGLTDGDDLPFVFLPAALDLYSSDEHTNAFIAEVTHWKKEFAKDGINLELVIVDTLSAATAGANENASEDVSRVLARCARISDECNVAVGLVHHMNATGDKVRGHTSIMANIDSVITVLKTDDIKDANGRTIRNVRLGKQKDGDDGLEFKFVLSSVVVGTNQHGEQITSCVCQHPAGSDQEIEAQKKEGFRLSPSAALMLRAVRNAVENFGQAPPNGLRVSASARVVRWQCVRDEFARLDATDEQDHEKRLAKIRTDVKRGGEKLLELNLINRDRAADGESYVWLTGRKVKNDIAGRRLSSSQLIDFDPADIDVSEAF